MKKRISIVLISALLFQLVGCYSTYYINSEELKLLDRDEEINVSTQNKEGYTTDNWDIDNDTLKFVAVVGIANANDELSGVDNQYGMVEIKKTIQIPISTIEEILIEEFNTTKTIWVTAATVGGIVVLFIATFGFY